MPMEVPTLEVVERARVQVQEHVIEVPREHIVEKVWGRSCAFAKRPPSGTLGINVACPMHACPYRFPGC